MPAEVRGLEELNDELSTIKWQLRLRRLRFALMAWLSGQPPLLNLEIAKNQRKLLLDRTFLSMMYIKEERASEASRLVLSRNAKAKCEVHSEVNLLSTIMQCEFFSKGIEAIKHEQLLIADLLSKNATLLELPKKGLEGRGDEVYEGMDKFQRGCLADTMSCIKTFSTQLKNRGTCIVPEPQCEAMLVTLHDFNTAVHNLCRNVWRLQISQEELCERSRKNSAQEWQAKYSGLEKEVIDGEKVKKEWEKLASLEAGMRCYEQVYEAQKFIKQDKYLNERIRFIGNNLRKFVMRDVKKELHDKDLELEELESQFAKYKGSLRSKLREEVMSSDISAEFKEFFPKRTLNINDKPESKKNNRQEEADKCLNYAKQKIEKLRVFYKFRLAMAKEKRSREVDLLRDTIIANTNYQTQLSLSERREFIAKQELVSAQESMISLEKALRERQKTLKAKNEALMHFNQGKLLKERRLTELEVRLKQCSDKSEALDMLGEISEKSKEIEELKDRVLSGKERARSVEKDFKEQLKSLKERLSNEKNVKETAYARAKKTQEKLDEAVNLKNKKDEALWKGKYRELLTLYAALKEESASLRRSAEPQHPRRHAQRKLHSVNNSVLAVETSGRTSMNAATTKARTEVATPCMGVKVKPTVDFKAQTAAPTKRSKTQTNFLAKGKRRYCRALSKVGK